MRYNGYDEDKECRYSSELNRLVCANEMEWGRMNKEGCEGRLGCGMVCNRVGWEWDGVVSGL